MTDVCHGYCYDIETNEEFWVSGIKKNGQDRHWCGGGKIMIDEEAIGKYLELLDLHELDSKKFEVISLKKTKKSRFDEIQNGNFSSVTTSSKYYVFSEMNISELKETISYLRRKEAYTQPTNGKKFLKMKIIEAEKLLQNLINNDE